jgi:hypothetical protein
MTDHAVAGKDVGIFVDIDLRVALDICLDICLGVHLDVCLGVHLDVCLGVCLGVGRDLGVFVSISVYVGFGVGVMVGVREDLGVEVGVGDLGVMVGVGGSIGVDHPGVVNVGVNVSIDFSDAAVSELQDISVLVARRAYQGESGCQKGDPAPNPDLARGLWHLSMIRQMQDIPQ